jgi:hypothetical protein
MAATVQPEAKGLEEAAVNKVACPECRRRTGSVCVTEAGRTRKHVHPKRIQALRDFDPELAATIEMSSTDQGVEVAKTMRIWTLGYTPFVMGGSTLQPICTHVPVTGPIKLPKGIEVYEARSPHGKTYVVEATTGGIVGDSVAKVRQDLGQAPQAVLAKQLAQQRAKGEQATELQPGDFWRRMEQGLKK